MTHKYAASKIPTSEQKTYRHWKWRVGKNIPSKQAGKKIGLAILISDKTDFKTKAIKRDTEGHFIILKENPSRRHKYYKHICTQHKSTQIYKENLGGLQERYRQQHNCSTGF